MRTELEELDNAVCAALGGADDARRGLKAALAACTAADVAVPAQITGCLQAADEHLGYGERMEARTLLTVAHRLLSRTSPRPVVLPGPREVDRVKGSARG
ncbi:hypothetical protein JNUCC0626_04450 [Lentzea sp. JNUCC 0626]|uniref:hypothetical protein n=1 Tax=Lentzea sp. JNUCC 0626 TaxID=3367513 RepID=UPI00374966DA